MISFITNTIDNPWTDNEVRSYERYGSQRDTVQFNSYYNWRIKLTEKNIFLCSLKTNDRDYKNVYLFVVTRRLFYFVIFIPQLEVIKQLNSNKQIQKILSVLPLTRRCLSSSNKELNFDDEILFLDGSCLLVKVSAPVDGFLFPRNKSITNNVIKQQYALLNNLYFQFEREFDGFVKLIGEYDSKLKRKIQEQQEKIKRMLVRKTVRMGVSLALASITGGLSLGLDALFDLTDVAAIQDVLDMVDAADFAGDTMDAFDAYDILDADLLDFNVDDMPDINIDDIGEGDTLLTDSYGLNSEDIHSDLDVDHSGCRANISFRASESQLKTDINYYNRKLNQANKDIDYYKRELKKPSLSNTYRESCLFRLEQAAKKVTEITDKIVKLKEELDRLTE